MNDGVCVCMCVCVCACMHVHSGEILAYPPPSPDVLMPSLKVCLITSSM